MPRYDPWKVEIVKTGQRHAQWTFAGHIIVGTEDEYTVTDRNYSNRNVWEFLVRIPRDKTEGIEVRPSRVPNIGVWAGLERRSVVFSRARKRAYRGNYYAKVTLADPTGSKTKDVVRSEERTLLPRWFRDLPGKLRSKDAVTSTKGTDGRQLVAVFRPDDHPGMIRLFFASKVWVLRQQFQLKRP